MPSLVFEKQVTEEQAVTMRLWVDGRIETVPSSLFVLGPQRGSRRAEDSGKHKIPNLGPTRQDTLLYFKTSRVESRKKPSQNYQHVIRDLQFPVSVASYPALPPKTAPSWFPSNTSAFKGMDVPRGVAKSYDNNLQRLMTGSINNFKYTKKHFISDCRPFTEDTKHCKETKTNERVIKPSKHGFHPRSYSPTFKCLVEASEKLNNLVSESPRYTYDISDLMSMESSTCLQNSLTDVQGSVSQCCESVAESVSTLNYSSISDIVPNKRNGNTDIKIHETTSEIHLFLPLLPDETNRKYKREFVPRKEPIDAFTMTENSLFPVINGSVSNSGSETSHRTRAEIPKRKRTQARRSLSPPKQRGKEKVVRTKTFDLHEPYLKGEMLKETLDDFPTLVSQNGRSVSYKCPN